MVEAVFSLMKPGAAVLFIDNAGGGFYELVSVAANRCGLINFSGPFRHMKYQNDVFKRKMFGFFSLSSTTVAVQMWQKPYPITLNGWAGHSVPQRLMDSQFKASNYGSQSLRAASLVAKQKMNQNSTKKKSENFIPTPANDTSKKYTAKASTDSCDILNSLPKVVGHVGHCSNEHKPILQVASSSLKSSKASLMPAPSIYVHPKQHNTNSLSEQALCANNMPKEKHSTLLSVSGHENLSVKSGIKEHKTRDSPGAKFKMPTSSLQDYKVLAVPNSSVGLIIHERDEECTDVYCDSESDMLTNTLGFKAQAVPSSSLDSATEHSFHNKRDEELDCCCIIL